MSNTFLVEAVTQDHSETMRKIRNECKDFMTEHREYISEDDQELWFNYIYKKAHAHEEMVAYLAGSSLDHPICVWVGYGIIRKKQGKWYVTAGMNAIDRSQGHGLRVFEMLQEKIAERGGTEVWLDVLQSNTVARSLYTKLGYEEVARTPTVITMKKDI